MPVCCFKILDSHRVAPSRLTSITNIETNPSPFINRNCRGAWSLTILLPRRHNFSLTEPHDQRERSPALWLMSSTSKSFRSLSRTRARIESLGSRVRLFLFLSSVRSCDDARRTNESHARGVGSHILLPKVSVWGNARYMHLLARASGESASNNGFGEPT